MGKILNMKSLKKRQMIVLLENKRVQDNRDNSEDFTGNITTPFKIQSMKFFGLLIFNLLRTK